MLPRDAVRESADAMAPTWDTFDPSAITGTELDCAAFSPTHIFGAIRAPVAAGSYTLVFRCASPWRAALPGGSFNASTGWLTKTFAAGESLVGVQITHVRKSGSTAGVWEVLP